MTSRRRAPWSTARSTSASRCSTPPTSTATAPRKSFLGETLGKRRQQVVIATKFGWGSPSGASRRTIMPHRRGEPEAAAHRLDRSLPGALSRSEHADRGNAARARRPGPRRQGARDRLLELLGQRRLPPRSTPRPALGTAAFVTCQDEYSLLVRKIERDLVPLMRKRGMTLLPYAPLAGGFLSGKYLRGKPLPKDARLAYSSHHATDVINERNWNLADRLRDFAARTGHSMLDVAFGWLLAQPVTASVIAGAMTPEQVEQNVRAGSDEAVGRRRRRARPDHAVGERMTKPRALIIGGSVGGLFAANMLRSIGWDADGVRAQRRGAGRPRRRHQHASAVARRHQAARHPVRRFDGHRASTAWSSSTTTAAPTTSATPCG